MDTDELHRLSKQFRQGLANNFALFQKHAFRKHTSDQDRRAPLNASLWDVMSTGLSRYAKDKVEFHADSIKCAFYTLLDDTEFQSSITTGTNDVKKVKHRFNVSHQTLEEILGDQTN